MLAKKGGSGSAALTQKLKEVQKEISFLNTGIQMCS